MSNPPGILVGLEHGIWPAATPASLTRNPADLARSILLLALSLTPKASLNAPPPPPEALPLQASAAEAA